jgi:hypothetical protein
MNQPCHTILHSGFSFVWLVFGAKSATAGLCIVLALAPILTVTAQWSTSPSTSNALQINYGFTAQVQTYDDGSSIFCHGLDNTIYVQRFDERGYRVWPNLTVAFDNPTADFGGGGVVHSDGAKGVVIHWTDHRGAYVNPSNGQYMNDGLYLQKVDSNGIVQWPAAGVLVSPPQAGVHAPGAVTDGAGGSIIFWMEQGFGYPGAPNRENLKVARFNASGQRLWETLLDSSFTQYRFVLHSPKAITRAGNKVYIGYYRMAPQQDFIRIVDINSGTHDTTWNGFFHNISWRDSILYSSSYVPASTYTIKKVSSSGELGWLTFVSASDTSCGGAFRYPGLIPDERGGVFFPLVCRDSIYHILTDGLVEQVYFAGIRSIGGYAFQTGSGGIVSANDAGFAQRYDSVGSRLWGETPIVYQSDPQNANLRAFWGDNKGGIIVTFWTPTRGLSAQHTGRYGSPGIVTTVDAQSDVPRGFVLYQNYPNPFNPSAIIDYVLPSRSTVKLTVFDVLGRSIVQLVPEQLQEAGYYKVTFDATSLASGVYFYELKANQNRQIKRMILLR